MAAPTKSIAAVDARAWVVTWGTENLGYCEDVDPSGMKLLEREKRFGELDDLLIDSEVYGMEGTVKLMMRDVNPERIRQVMPWAAATGSFPVSPGGGAYSMYGGAKLLNLHPRGIAAATLTSDLNFLKAFPIVALPKGGKAKDWRMMSIEFRLFPDQTALTDATAPSVVYGYVGLNP